MFTAGIKSSPSEDCSSSIAGLAPSAKTLPHLPALLHTLPLSSGQQALGLTGSSSQTTLYHLGYHGGEPGHEMGRIGRRSWCWGGGSPVNQRRRKGGRTTPLMPSVCPGLLCTSLCAQPETQGITAPVSFTCNVGNQTQGLTCARRALYR